MTATRRIKNVQIHTCMYTDIPVGNGTFYYILESVIRVKNARKALVQRSNYKVGTKS